MSYINTQEIYYIKARLPKEDSAFFYFTLEACDNLCFYSTIPHETGQTYRDIEIRCTIEFKEQLELLLAQLERRVAFQKLEEKIYKN